MTEKEKNNTSFFMYSYVWKLNVCTNLYVILRIPNIHNITTYSKKHVGDNPDSSVAFKGKGTEAICDF